MSPLLTLTDRGSGFPLLFLHAFPLNQRMWAPQTSHFEKEYRLLLPDLAGFGLAPPVDAPVPLETYAEELCRELTRLGVRECAGIGLSLGGYLLFALHRAHPELFRALVFADTRAAADGEEGRKNRLRQIEEIRGGGLQAFLDGMLARAAGEHTRAHRYETMCALRALMDDATEVGTMRMLETLAGRPDATGLLGKIAAPVCLIAGEEDPIIPPAEMEAMAAAIPSAEFHRIPLAGHISNLEDPEAFNDILEDFLHRAAPPSRG